MKRTQQEALYASEYSTDMGQTFDSLQAVQEFVDELREAWWWERNCPQVKRIEVGELWSKRWAGCGSWLPDEGVGLVEFRGLPRMGVVLHEVAHVLSNARFGGRGHHPWFARIYLELTYWVRGPQAYTELAAAFARDGIDADADGVVDSNAIPMR